MNQFDRKIGQTNNIQVETKLKQAEIGQQKC